MNLLDMHSMRLVLTKVNITKVNGLNKAMKASSDHIFWSWYQKALPINSEPMLIPWRAGWVFSQTGSGKPGWVFSDEKCLAFLWPENRKGFCREEKGKQPWANEAPLFVLLICVQQSLHNLGTFVWFHLLVSSHGRSWNSRHQTYDWYFNPAVLFWQQAQG